MNETWPFDTLDVRKNGHVLTVLLNRPDRLNAFNAEMALDLAATWDRARFDDDIRVIVLSGAGRAFCSGVDRAKSFTDTPNRWNREDPKLRLGPKSARLWKPVICAVNGPAAGGAFYFVNESDIVIASEDAEFFDPHLTFNLVSSCEPIGALGRAPYGEVMRMVLLGSTEHIGAERAREIGLVSDVLPATDLMTEARRLADTIAECSPLAVQGSVRAVWTAHTTVYASALETCIHYGTIGNDPTAVAEGVERLRSGSRASYRVR